MTGKEENALGRKDITFCRKTAKRAVLSSPKAAQSPPIRPHKLKLKHIYSFIESPDSLYSTYIDSYDKDDIFGFGDIYASDNRIYSVFDGEINRLIYMEESMLGDPQQYPAFPNIAVFDWKGAPQELIRTGTRIENIHVDERDHRLYALYYDDNGDLRIGTLNLEP